MVDIAPLRESLPELPSQTRAWLVSLWTGVFCSQWSNHQEQSQGLTPDKAAHLVSWPGLLSFFTSCLEQHPVSRKEVADIVITILAEHCNSTGQKVQQLILL